MVVWNQDNMIDRNASITMRFMSNVINDSVEINYGSINLKNDIFILEDELIKYFGGNMLDPIDSTSTTEFEKTYVLLNSEVLFDTNIIGFEYNAFNDGKIELEVLIFILD